MRTNRLIKFRVWDKQRKKYMEPNILALTLGDNPVLGYNTKQGLYPIPDTGQRDLGIDRFVLEQFTGLLGKDSKEIYEGDIVKNLDGDIYTVVFNHGAFKCRCVKDGQGYVLTFHGGEWQLEVIGNIHETPI